MVAVWHAFETKREDIERGAASGATEAARLSALEQARDAFYLEYELMEVSLPQPDVLA